MKKHSELGQRLQAERNNLGLTQQELAERLGVDKSSVYLYERGDRPPNAYHLMVMYELGADVFFILTGKRVETAMSDDWLHRTMLATREVEETGAWAKLDWQEREEVIGKFLRVR